MRAWEERLSETIKHRLLNKNVSYKHLVKLECYKMAKYILKDEPEYKPLKSGGDFGAEGRGRGWYRCRGCLGLHRAYLAEEHGWQGLQRQRL